MVVAPSAYDDVDFEESVLPVLDEGLDGIGSEVVGRCRVGSR